MYNGKRPVIYAFIDSQNLNLGTSKDLYNKLGRKIYTGWKLDFKKFRCYLRDKFRVDRAFFFIGYLEKHKEFYKEIESYGYNIVFKPTVVDNRGKIKGNVDAELVLHTAAVEFPKYNKAVVVSGDGDFYCLYDYLKKQEKLGSILIPNKKSASSLLKRFENYKTFVVFDKFRLELKGVQKMGGVAHKHVV